jgi:hypothetical protein
VKHFLVWTAAIRTSTFACESLPEGYMATRSGLLREGVIAGAIGATSVAIWFLLVDTIAGRPLHTPRILGAAFFSVLGTAMTPDSASAQVLGYTVFHYIAFAVLGIIAAALIRAAQSEPNIVAGLVVLFVAFEAGFYGLTALLSQSELMGNFAWYQVGAANLIAAGLMGFYLLKVHPELRQEMDYALSGRE